jgi:hypothetical protein
MKRYKIGEYGYELVEDQFGDLIKFEDLRKIISKTRQFAAELEDETYSD